MCKNTFERKNDIINMQQSKLINCMNKAYCMPIHSINRITNCTHLLETMLSKGVAPIFASAMCNVKVVLKVGEDQILHHLAILYGTYPEYLPTLAGSRK